MDILDKIDILLINEVKFKKVVRGGKLKRKLICPAGFKALNGRCVKMKASEARKRSKATRKAQKRIQSSGKAAKLIRKRAKSMRKRNALIPTAPPPELKV